MELIKESVTMNETLYADRSQAYVEGDIIVPDVKPDILKILQVDAVSSVVSKELADGRLTIAGKVNLTILYIPEREGDSIQSITSVFDFSERIERQGITDSAVVSLDTDIERVEFNLINSRKLSVKSTVVLDCRISGEKELEFVTGVEEGNAECMRSSLNVNSIITNAEHEFVIRERIEVPAGKVSIGELLKVDARITDKETKAITGKLVAKGVLNMCVLYVGSGGSIEFMEADIPFTEVFDADNLNEDMDCTLDFEICELHYETEEDSDGDIRILNIELLANAKISASENTTVDMVSDFFCPAYNTQLIYSDMEFDEVVARPRTQNTLREVISIDNKLPQISGVYNVITKTVITKAAPDHGKIAAEGKIEAYILYLTDNAQSPVYSVKKEISFSYLLDAPAVRPGMECRIRAEVEHTSYSLNVANEVELRCMLVISAEAVEKKTVRLITDCTVEPMENKKGIVIYFIQNGDTMWDIAKRYCVSVDDILQYNQLSAEDRLTVGEKLIIPAVCAKS